MLSALLKSSLAVSVFQSTQRESHTHNVSHPLLQLALLLHSLLIHRTCIDARTCPLPAGHRGKPVCCPAAWRYPVTLPFQTLALRTLAPVSRVSGGAFLFGASHWVEVQCWHPGHALLRCSMLPTTCKAPAARRLPACDSLSQCGVSRHRLAVASPRKPMLPFSLGSAMPC